MFPEGREEVDRMRRRFQRGRRERYNNILRVAAGASNSREQSRVSLGTRRQRVEEENSSPPKRKPLSPFIFFLLLPLSPSACSFKYEFNPECMSITATIWLEKPQTLIMRTPVHNLPKGFFSWPKSCMSWFAGLVPKSSRKMAKERETEGGTKKARGERCVRWYGRSTASSTVLFERTESVESSGWRRDYRWQWRWRGRWSG